MPAVCNTPIAMVMVAEGPVERDYLQSILHEAAVVAWAEGKLPKAEKPKLVEEGFINEDELGVARVLHNAVPEYIP